MKPEQQEKNETIDADTSVDKVKSEEHENLRTLVHSLTDENERMEEKNRLKFVSQGELAIVYHPGFLIVSAASAKQQARSHGGIRGQCSLNFCAQIFVIISLSAPNPSPGYRPAQQSLIFALPCVDLVLRNLQVVGN